MPLFMQTDVAQAAKQAAVAEDVAAKDVVASKARYDSTAFYEQA